VVVSGVVGRVRPDGLAEWYVKDYQGSLAFSVVGNGYGSAFSYHSYGAQNLLRSDGQAPTEQYTGKEWDETYEFYYYGARFLDPVLGLWVVPDPAGQYVNPYAFGFDPINGVDPNGMWFGIDDAIAAVVGAVAGAGVALYKGHDPLDAKFWGYTAGGAAIAWASYATAGAATAALGSGFGATTAGGAVAGAISGAGQYTLNSGLDNRFSDFNIKDLAINTSIGAATGAITAGALYGVGKLADDLTGKSFSDVVEGVAGDPKIPVNSGTQGTPIGSVGVKASFGGIAKELISTGVCELGLTGIAHLGATMVGGPGLDLVKFGTHLWLNEARELKKDLVKKTCKVDGFSDWCPEDYKEDSQESRIGILQL
jgi:RHS repeat-associated protein